MAIDITTLALAKAYAKKLFESGNSSGKNVTISSITAIDGGNRIAFSYTEDDGTNKTSTLDVMDGKQGASIVNATINSNKELILTLSDETTVNAGTVPSINGENGKDGSNGADGVSITGVQIDDDNHLIITLSNQETIDAGLIETIAGKDGSNGADGQDGKQGASITAITFIKDENENIVGGIATLSDDTEIDISIVVA